MEKVMVLDTVTSIDWSMDTRERSTVEVIELNFNRYTRSESLFIKVTDSEELGIYS
jgi:hypothetical protein